MKRGRTSNARQEGAAVRGDDGERDAMRGPEHGRRDGTMQVPSSEGPGLASDLVDGASWGLRRALAFVRERDW